MMSKLLLSIAYTLSSAFLPLTAHAYLTPDQVLDDEDYSARFYEPPPSKREINDVVRKQQEASAARRQAEWDAAHPEEETHEAAPDEEATNEEPSDIEDLIKALEQYNNDQAAAEDTEDDGDSVVLTAGEKRDLRLVERLRDRQMTESDDRYTAWLATQGGGKTLHSGAPLTGTGPATVLVTLAIAAAIGETWRRVRKADKA